MEVTVLGSSGTYGAPDNPCSGYLVQSQGVSLLIDAGPGTLGALQQFLSPGRLDAVLLSHSHPDHWVDAPVLRNALRYVLDRSGMPVYSTAETLTMLSTVCHEDLTPTFHAEPISDGDEIRVGDLRVRCSRTHHPPETLGFLIDDGKCRVAYSADTGPAWGFGELTTGGIDLGICEATFREGSVREGADAPVHMTALQAGEMARSARTARLVITHLLPGADREGAAAEAQSAYGAAVEVATPGLSMQI